MGNIIVPDESHHESPKTKVIAPSNKNLKCLELYYEYLPFGAKKRKSSYSKLCVSFFSSTELSHTNDQLRLYIVHAAMITGHRTSKQKLMTRCATPGDLLGNHLGKRTSWNSPFIFLTRYTSPPKQVRVQWYIQQASEILKNPNLALLNANVRLICTNAQKFLINLIYQLLHTSTSAPLNT